MNTEEPFSVSIQTEASPILSVPAWFGEVALVAHTLTRQGVLSKISDEVRFARKRFGTFEVIDFVVVLMGYAISGEPTLAAYYERLQPFATAFMALFGRAQLPHRSTLSRFLAALDQASVEALRNVFVQDALEHPGPAEGVGGLWDRKGQRWVVFDLDGTRQAARQRALPQGPDLPPPERRLQPVCVHLAIQGASVGKWFAHGRPSYRPIPISGWEHLGMRAMVTTAGSCCAGWR
jgi:hypothetical protein